MWLGTRDSYESVANMQKAVNDGNIMSLMASSPELAAMAALEDDEDYRIGQEIIQVVNNVAIITVSGSLVSSHNWYNQYFGLVSYEQIRDAIDMATSDGNVTNIILHIESSGGTIVGLDDLGEYIFYVSNNVKPINGHTTSHAHSAGYWLLSSTKSITASKTASLGSIGVLMTLTSYKKMYDNLGIEFTYIRSGKFKALGQAGEELSEEAVSEFTEMIMELHGFFVAQVLRGRGAMASQNTSAWTEGKTFLAGKAKSLGLVDEITTLDNVVAKMVKTVDNRFMVDSNVTSEYKDAIMKLKSLTKEQQAKLASGVPLEKLGLSDTELADAKAELETIMSKSNSDDNSSADSGSDGQGAEAEGDNIANADKVSAENDDSSKELSGMSELLELNTSLTKQNAKLEVKLEQLTEKLQAKDKEIEQFMSNEKELLTIAGEAINKFQVAVGAQATSLEGMGVKAILNSYAEAKNTFEATFKVGAASMQSSGSRDTQDSLKPLNPIKKLVKE